MLKRRNEEEDGSLVGSPPPASMSECDVLWSFLVDQTWDEGSARVPGSITLFVDGPRLKAALNDRDLGEVGFVTLELDKPLFPQLEGALRSDRIDWRRSGRKR